MDINLADSMTSILPPNWEEIANMRLQMLELEYQECQNAQIKGDPNDFKGLQYVLDQTDEQFPQEQENSQESRVKDTDHYLQKANNDSDVESEPNQSSSDEDEGNNQDGFEDFQDGGYHALESDHDSADNELPAIEGQQENENQSKNQDIPDIKDDEEPKEYKESQDIFHQSFQNVQTNHTVSWNQKDWDEIDEDKLQIAKAQEKKRAEDSQPMTEDKQNQEHDVKIESSSSGMGQEVFKFMYQ
ncbi:UNKNOWN [Stylonychia lemnae]|uniref:Uncharacterized protein n=1 Tax=Stylonychia lemnae TaxID=5949 RepID=A0A078B7P4_STYLE|nr:UNKNOWN [Stylonychia lemnae]|eukprot:CDW90530.1 UNKNOWN [Stylonychia lemnae]